MTNPYETIGCVECGEQTIAARPVCGLCEADRGLFPKKVHDRRNYVNEELMAAWNTFNPQQQQLIRNNAQELADKEEWE